MAIDLETFLGEWKDSLGNDVTVEWAKPGSRGGQLSVVLSKPRSSRDPIRLDVKSVGKGRFVCGHYDLDLEDSSEDRIVWADCRNRGKTSVWKRTGKHGASRSRSRSRRNDRRPKAVLDDTPRGNWQSGYGLPPPAVYWAQAAPGWAPPEPPRSAVASEGPTPGAWVPPSVEVQERSQSPPGLLALPAPEPGVFEEPSGAVLMPMVRAAPVKVLPPPPLVDEMEEFDKLLLQAEAGHDGSAPLHQEKSRQVEPQQRARDERKEARRQAKAKEREARDSERAEAEARARERHEKEQREQREQELKELKELREAELRKEETKPKAVKAKKKLPMAVKLEVIEDEAPKLIVSDNVQAQAQAQEPVREEPSRDPRRRTTDEHQEHQEEEATVQVLVDPYLVPEPDTALSVEVLQPKVLAKQAIPKRRRAAPKRAIAKRPAVTPEQERKLQEIKHLLEMETAMPPLAMSGMSPPGMPPVPPPPPVPALPMSTPISAPITPVAPTPMALAPMAPMLTPTTPRIVKASVPLSAEEEERQRRLNAYSNLLLGGDDEDAQEPAPWKRQKRRRAVGVEL